MLVVGRRPLRAQRARSPAGRTAQAREAVSEAHGRWPGCSAGTRLLLLALLVRAPAWATYARVIIVLEERSSAVLAVLSGLAFCPAPPAGHAWPSRARWRSSFVLALALWQVVRPGLDDDRLPHPARHPARDAGPRAARASPAPGAGRGAHGPVPPPRAPRRGRLAYNPLAHARRRRLLPPRAVAVRHRRHGGDRPATPRARPRGPDRERLQLGEPGPAAGARLRRRPLGRPRPPSRERASSGSASWPRTQEDVSRRFAWRGPEKFDGLRPRARARPAPCWCRARSPTSSAAWWRAHRGRRPHHLRRRGARDPGARRAGRSSTTAAAIAGWPRRARGMSAPMEFPERFNMAWYFLDRNVEEGRGGQALPLLARRGLHLPRGPGAVQPLRQRAARASASAVEDRVLLVLPDRPEFAFAWFGAAKVGRGDRHGQPAAARRRTSSTTSSTRGPRWRWWTSRPSTASSRCATRFRYLRHLVVVGEPRGRTSRSRRPARRPGTASRTRTPTATIPAIWLFTSGSTGKPKAAVHLQQDLPWNTERYAKQVMGIREDDLTVSVPKLFFGYATGTNLLFPFAVGAATALFSERSEPATLFDVIERYQPTILTSVPTMINGMLNHPGRDRRATSRRCAWCSPRARRCPPSCTGAGRRPSGSRSWTASGRRRCSTSTSRTTRATWCPAAWAGWCPATRRASWTRDGRDVARRRGGHAVGEGRVGRHPLLAGPREVEGGPARRLGGHRRPHAAGRARATSGTRAGRTTC